MSSKVNVDEIERAVKGALIEIIQERFTNDYITLFETLYDEFLVRAFNFNADDHTAPINIKQDVIEFIIGELDKAVMSLSPDKPIIIEAIPDALISMPVQNETDSVKLFYFYLVGTPGKYVVIRSSDYEKIFPFAKGNISDLGRFGNMFMLPYDQYVNMYERVPSNFTQHWPAPDSIVHPFSGAPPIRLFETAALYLEDIVRAYVDNMAIQVTATG